MENVTCVFTPFEVKDSQIGLMQGVNHDKDLYTVKLHLRIQTPPYPRSQKKIYIYTVHKNQKYYITKN